MRNFFLGDYQVQYPDNDSGDYVDYDINLDDNTELFRKFRYTLKIFMIQYLHKHTNLSRDGIAKIDKEITFEIVNEVLDSPELNMVMDEISLNEDEFVNRIESLFNE